MLGSWDTNYGVNPSNDEVKLFGEFIDSGRGFLAGHDTIGYNWGTTIGLGQIRDKFNIKVGYWGNANISTDEGHHYYGGYIGTKVTVKRKGLLTNYPWNIEDTKGAKELDKDNNVILTVPYSHSTSNFAYGDIWMTYSDNVKYDNSNFPDSLNEKANYYLTTYNNTAMIQTGHSNGAATPDEQKVLANTLFYLAQVTEDTKWDDHKGQDLKAPTKPELKSVIKDGTSNKLVISYGESQDVGSSYDYYVEAKEKATGSTVNSDVKTTTVTSGLKGYSIAVDQNKDTIPDNTIESASTEYTIDNKFNDDFYVHVAAVDNAGNISEVSTFKYAYPVLKLTPNTTEVVKDTVTITAEAACGGNSIVKIIAPDGKEVEGDKAEYTVDVNGIYTFKAIDNKGDEVTESIEITNIVPDVILNVEPNMNRVHLEEHFVVDITADHIKDIGGFDLVVKYDSDKLKLTGYEQIPGVKYLVKRLGPGEVRLTVFGMTDKNFVYSKKTLLKLGFDPIAPGDALIDITKAKISDGLLLEKKLSDAECGEATVTIVNRKLTSVNSDDNEFTLLDATIVSRHMGEDPEELLLAGIDADLNLDGKIDEADVEKAYKLMMKNPNYDI